MDAQIDIQRHSLKNTDMIYYDILSQEIPPWLCNIAMEMAHL